MDRLGNIVKRVLSPVGVVVLWEIISRMALVEPYLLPAPSKVVWELLKLLASGELLIHIYSSMGRVLAGYSLAVISGICLGVLMGWFRIIDQIADPLVELARPVSPLAILPVTILWFGIGNVSKIFIIWYSCIFPVVLNTYAGVKGVNPSVVHAARTLGATNQEILWRVVVPSTLPLIMTGARISMAIGMIVIIASEMVAARAGLGYLILTAEQTYRTTEMFAGIAVIAALGLLLDRLLRLLRRKVSPWYTELAVE